MITRVIWRCRQCGGDVLSENLPDRCPIGGCGSGGPFESRGRVPDLDAVDPPKGVTADVFVCTVVTAGAAFRVYGPADRAASAADAINTLSRSGRPTLVLDAGLRVERVP